ncbi:MAG: hypothetical protein ACYCYF_01185 [Anaerolineae bacterium]
MYANLEQRMVHTYLDLLPPFAPSANAPVTAEAQEEFHTFVRTMLETLYAQPDLLLPALHGDDGYPNRYNRAAYGKPALLNTMRSDLKRLDDWFAFLYEAGRTGVVSGDTLRLNPALKVKKAHRELLPHAGLTLADGTLRHDSLARLFEAWAWMAKREGADVVRFSRCMFDPACRYMESVYARLVGDSEAFARLVRYLDDRGYEYHEMVRDASTVDYAREHAEHPTPLRNPLYVDPNHTGISFDYQRDAAIPQYVVLRIRGMKGLLERFAAMPDRLQAFVLEHCKVCDDCGYCTQTDKTGKRRPQHVWVTRGEQHIRLCPLYPGFTFTFTALDPALYEDLVAFLTFMDG